MVARSGWTRRPRPTCMLLDEQWWIMNWRRIALPYDAAIRLLPRVLSGPVAARTDERAMTNKPS